MKPGNRHTYFVTRCQFLQDIYVLGDKEGEH
ncbi:hypothetical protein DES34_105166 [Brevibacillus brevis]|nr:hypothetical protein DES34_105166 [Brevibacillus brevis]TQK74763.1 hypothetical protein FB479_101372 [Brevibacillus sp. AG162]